MTTARKEHDFDRGKRRKESWMSGSVLVALGNDGLRFVSFISCPLQSGRLNMQRFFDCRSAVYLAGL